MQLPPALLHGVGLFFALESPPPLQSIPKTEAKRKSPESFESTNDSELSHAADGGRTRTLSPERDFKSLVSASLRQSQFPFVVSFDFSLRERFFLREREGFALF